MRREVGSFREVLAQQTVGVLVRAALPGAMGIAEVDVDVDCQRQSPVVRKLLAAVPGE